MRSSRATVLFALPLLGLVGWVGFLLNGQLLSSSVGCDRRIEQISSQKDQSMRQLITQLDAVLHSEAETVRKLKEEQVERRRLYRQLLDIRNGRRGARGLPPARGGQGSSPAGSVTAEPIPGSLVPSNIAVVVIAYNRPHYLTRALTSILSHHPGGHDFTVYVSQDGEDDAVRQVVEKHGVRRLVHPRRALKLKEWSYIAKHPGYAYLSVHYGWALKQLFNRQLENSSAKAYEGVIILEEDIEVSD